jgi:carbamoyl-phosphate synthase / aspartate carbamoyltransferase
LGEDSNAQQKSEYSLTQHLANNLIDMYINLPSKNHYRRPATYTSKGYRTRRMAVDFAIPLITNVKNAKLLAEALVRKLSLDVSSVDSKSSHTTHTFPGLINIAAFVPNITNPDSEDFAQLTKASISAGLTTALILPLGDDDRITDGSSLDKARANTARSAHCNYAFSIAASANNIQMLNEEIQADTKSLFIPFHAGTAATQISVVAAHFASWPVDKRPRHRCEEQGRSASDLIEQGEASQGHLRCLRVCVILYFRTVLEH